MKKLKNTLRIIYVKTLNVLTVFDLKLITKKS